MATGITRSDPKKRELFNYSPLVYRFSNHEIEFCFSLSNIQTLFSSLKTDVRITYHCYHGY